MKEITYEGNLEEDINLSKEDFDIEMNLLKEMKRNYKFYSLLFLSSLLRWRNGFHFLSALSLASIVIVIYKNLDSMEQDFSEEKKDAILRLISLSEALNSDENEINIKLKDLKRPIKTEIESTSYYNLDYFSSLKEDCYEKEVRYFYFLDRDSQVQILKEISIYLKDNEKIEQHELYLLEEQDKQNLERQNKIKGLNLYRY